MSHFMFLIKKFSEWHWDIEQIDKLSPFCMTVNLLFSLHKIILNGEVKQ